MKKFILSALALISLSLSSCKKDFLDTFPTTAVAAVDALANTKNAIAALNGIHRVMYTQYDAQGQSGEGACNLFRDYMGEDLVYPLANGSTGHITWYQWQNHRNVNAGDMRFVFRFYYRLISNANVLINGIDAVPGPDNEKKFVKGSALAYRGWAHFQLVQLYGIRYDRTTMPNSQPGVPLMLTNLPLNVGQARATVEEVYAQVNLDLNEAQTLLTGIGVPAGGGSAIKSNFSVNVVRGIKARVALAQQDWDAAATNAIAARSGFPLMSNAEYVSGFNNIVNQEWIWGSRQIDDHNTFFWSYFAYLSCNFNSTVIRTQPKAMNQNLWNAIPLTDVRKLCWDGNIGTANTTPVPPGGAKVRYQNKKFLAKSESLSVGDVPYIRSGEMFLIEAEARARQGGQEVASRAALNALRANRYITGSAVLFVPSTATGQALIDEIMWNRRVELWGEGHRFTDLKRTNQQMSRAGIPNHLPALTLVTTIPAGDKQWQFLFPQDELNANPLVIQNPL